MPGIASENPGLSCRGTKGSNPAPSSGESCKLIILVQLDGSRLRSMISVAGDAIPIGDAGRQLHYQNVILLAPRALCAVHNQSDQRAARQCADVCFPPWFPAGSLLVATDTSAT
jgi:hypothetical protein